MVLPARLPRVHPTHGCCICWNGATLTCCCSPFLLLLQLRLQQRAPLRAAARRRFVCGLRETQKLLLQQVKLCTPQTNSLSVKGWINVFKQLYLDFTYGVFVTFAPLRVRALLSYASCPGIFVEMHVGLSSQCIQLCMAI